MLIKSEKQRILCSHLQLLVHITSHNVHMVYVTNVARSITSHIFNVDTFNRMEPPHYLLPL